MIPEVFANQALPVRDQYEAWRAWSLPLIDVTSAIAVDGGFCAENHVWRLDDGLLLTQLTLPASHTVRSSRLIRHLPADHWVITHLLRGTSAIETSRGVTEVQASQSCVWSLGQVSSSKRSEIERIDVLLSRDTFHDIAPLLDAAVGAVLDASLGRFLSDFLQALLERLPLLLDSDAPNLTIAIGKLVAACVAPSASRVEEARVLIDVGRLEKIRQTIRSHLQSPLLGPEMLCRHVGMSRSNLYRLLESEGGVAAYIQRHRLMEARSRLSDIRNTQSIAMMAHDLCFTDSSTFSRAFRSMFGLSPGDARAATAKPDMADPVSPKSRQTQARINFSDLLRRH